MQVSDEALVAAISSIVVGIILRGTAWLMARKDTEDKNTEDKITKYHSSMEKELELLWEENRKLREETDKYRKLYFDLLSELKAKNTSDGKGYLND